MKNCFCSLLKASSSGFPQLLKLIFFFPPHLNSKVLLSRRNGNPAVEVLGDFDEKFIHDHRSRTSSGGTPRVQLVGSLFPVISWFKSLQMDGGQLAYSAHTSGVLPRQLPVIIIERKTFPGESRAMETASVAAERQLCINF